MRIKTLISYGGIESGCIVEALLTKDKTQAVIFNNDNCAHFYNHNQFEIVEEESRPMREVLDEVLENVEAIPKVYGNKYTLSELKELKELLK